MTNLLDQHWEKLFGQLTTKKTSWYGIWTVYSPAKEVVKTFQGVRNFSANEDKTVITHTNNYTYSDGSKEEKTWLIEKEKANQPDGIIHPAISSMRSVSLGQGVNAWVRKKLESGQKFGVELFFQYQDWRTSVASIYGDGDLEKITIIREHLGSFPQEQSGLEVENISGNWIGKKEFITPDLKVSPASEIPEFVLEPTRGKNKTFFFGDNIVMNIPKQLRVGEEFEIVSGKLVAENQYKRLTAKYDKSGDFAGLIFEVFYRKE